MSDRKPFASVAYNIITDTLTETLSTALELKTVAGITPYSIRVDYGEDLNLEFYEPDARSVVAGRISEERYIEMHRITPITLSMY